MANVIVYSTPTCGYCVMAKDFLKEHNVDFKEIDVSQDQQAAQEMMNKTGQMGVPVVAITKDDGEEKVMVGYNPDEMAKALNLQA
ncbi:MAG: glutaredoxin family protein [Candidatus Moranbacteria bacterium]|nr:glutaredoxin family protein [Candidatus Moranbacteria bacterium]